MTEGQNDMKREDRTNTLPYTSIAPSPLLPLFVLIFLRFLCVKLPLLLFFFFFLRRHAAVTRNRLSELSDCRCDTVEFIWSPMRVNQDARARRMILIRRIRLQRLRRTAPTDRPTTPTHTPTHAQCPK